MHLMYTYGGYVKYLPEGLSWILAAGVVYGALRLIYDAFRLLGFIERSNREKAARARRQPPAQ